MMSPANVNVEASRLASTVKDGGMARGSQPPSASTFQVYRSDVEHRPLVGMGFTSRQQAENCAASWLEHYSDHGIDMELEVVEIHGQQQEDAVRAIRAFYKLGRTW